MPKVPSNQISVGTGVCSAGLRWGTAIGLVGAPMIFTAFATENDVESIGQLFLILHLTLGVALFICFVLIFLLYNEDTEKIVKSVRSS